MLPFVLPETMRDLWCCPIPDCRQALTAQPDALVCSGPAHHRFGTAAGYPSFAPAIDVGKYTADYAAKYAFLWSYGYETLGSGLVEGIYRTTTALSAEALAECGTDQPVVVDCGCGVGRVSADLARLAPRGHVIGLDASPFKLALASEILLGTGIVERSLPEIGFPQSLRIQGRGLANVSLAQADAFAMPLPSQSADLVVSLNLIDRLGHAPDLQRTLPDFFSEVRRVLRPRGRFVLLSPLNWLLPEEWRRYAGATQVKETLEASGFAADVCFDQLLYRELLDARGSVEEFTTVALSAVVI